jgi:carboxypeptidase family protein
MQKCILQASFLVVAFLAFFCTALQAQDAATLTGTVRDGTGAGIPGVRELKNTATGSIDQLTTNSAGECVAAALLSGEYNLTVSLTGFRTYLAKGVILRVAQNARNDVTMTVGSLHEEVTIPSIDPDAKILMNMIPEGNLGSGANSIFAAAIARPTHWREDLVRIDHDFTCRASCSLRLESPSSNETCAVSSQKNQKRRAVS